MKQRIFPLLLVTLLILAGCNPTPPAETSLKISTVKPAEGGYFEKTSLPLDENINLDEDTLFYADGSVYLMGAVTTDDPYTPETGILKMNLADQTSEIMILDTFLMNVSDFCVTPDGYYLLLRSYDSQTFDDVYSLLLSDGKTVVWEKPVSDYFTLPESYYGNVQLAANGSRLCLIGDTQYVVIDGNETISGDLEDQILSVIPNENGGFDLFGVTKFGSTDSTGALGSEDLDRSEEITAIRAEAYLSGPGADYYYITLNGLYAKNFGEDASEIVNWTDNGMLYENMGDLALTEDGRILLVGSSERYRADTLFLLTHSDGEQPEREIITVSYVEDGTGALPFAVIGFNESQDKYKVVAEEYRSTHTGEFQAMMSQFDADILTGDLADVVILDSKEDLDRYGELGLFVDLNQALSDPEDLFISARIACETSGKLYGISPEFRVQTMVTKTANLEENTKWNSGAFLDIAENVPDGAHLFTTLSRGNVEEWMMDSVMTEFIDWENNNCAFLSDEFKRVVGYLGTLPAEPVTAFEDGANHYITGEVLFYGDNTSISCDGEYLMAKAAFGGEPVSFLGYPNGDGGASIVEMYQTFYAVSAKAKCPEGAVAFVEYLLSGETIVDEMKGMRRYPTSRSCLYDYLELQQTLYYFFPKGSELYNYHISPQPFEEDEGAGLYFTADQALYDEMCRFLDGIRPARPLPDQIKAILREELSSYYAGIKSADEVADVVQSRVSIYLAERTD